MILSKKKKQKGWKFKRGNKKRKIYININNIYVYIIFIHTNFAELLYK